MSRKFTMCMQFVSNFGYYRRLGYSTKKAWHLAGSTL